MNRFRTGDLVRVKSAADIAATLDDDGRLDGMPFMPEMLEHCGKTFTVSRSAHKTCDTVNKTGGRQLPDTVHLGDLRCNGSAHGGCEAHCLFFWKTQWLEDATASSSADSTDLHNIDLRVSEKNDGTLIYQCQATKLPSFTKPLSWWDVRQYWLDIRSGNESLSRVIETTVSQALRNAMAKLPGFRIWLWLHNQLQKYIGGVPMQASSLGLIAEGESTPVENLELRIGELVEIKTFEEIRATLSVAGKNRGMRYDIEMLPHSGRQARVAAIVTKIIDETSGKMINMKTPCIILEGIYCESRYSSHRLFCPRRLPSFWREIWLKRVENHAQAGVIPVRNVN